MNCQVCITPWNPTSPTNKPTTAQCSNRKVSNKEQPVLIFVPRRYNTSHVGQLHLVNSGHAQLILTSFHRPVFLVLLPEEKILWKTCK